MVTFRNVNFKENVNTLYLKMSNKPVITYRDETPPPEKLRAPDVIVSGVVIFLAFVCITCVLSLAFKIACLALGCEFSWVAPSICGLVIMIVLCTL